MIDAIVRALVREEARSPIPLPPGVALRRGRWIPALGGRLAGLHRPAAAVALGRTIVIHPAVEPTPRLLRHELAHVRQWAREPVTFPLRYLWQHARHGYRDNPYEVEARDAEQQRGPTRRGDHG